MCSSRISETEFGPRYRRNMQRLVTPPLPRIEQQMGTSLHNDSQQLFVKSTGTPALTVIDLPVRMPSDPRVALLFESLNDCPRRKILECANQLGLSISRLRHLFKTQTGISLASYLRLVRLKFAARQLLATNDPIKAVASSAGYAHSSSFARAFEAAFRESPRTYRWNSLHVRGAHL